MMNEEFCSLAKRRKDDPGNMILGDGGSCQRVRVQTMKEGREEK